MSITKTENKGRVKLKIDLDWASSPADNHHFCFVCGAFERFLDTVDKKVLRIIHL